MNSQQIVSVKLDDEEIAYFEAWRMWFARNTPIDKRVLTVSAFLHDCIKKNGKKFFDSLDTLEK